MKKRILLFTAVAGIGCLTLMSYETGPGHNGYDCTGADASSGAGNPTGCSGSGCHSASATAGITVLLELDSAGITTSSTALGTGHYKPGYTYTVKITGTNTTSTSLPKFGFQVGATKGATAAASPINTGTFQSTGLPTGVAYITAPGSSSSFYVNVVEHSSPRPATYGTGGSGTTYVESFTWKAPATGTGTVSLWAALNAVNGNTNADAGDKWNICHLVLNESPGSASVAGVTAAMGITAFPNPVKNELNLQLSDVAPGDYSVKAYDLGGRIFASEQITVNSTTGLTNINTSNWKAGMYEVVIEKDGVHQVIPVFKQ